MNVKDMHREIRIKYTNRSIPARLGLFSRTEIV